MYTTQLLSRWDIGSLSSNPRSWFKKNSSEFYLTIPWLCFKFYFLKKLWYVIKRWQHKNHEKHLQAKKKELNFKYLYLFNLLTNLFWLVTVLALISILLTVINHNIFFNCCFFFNWIFDSSSIQYTLKKSSENILKRIWKVMGIFFFKS